MQLYALDKNRRLISCKHAAKQRDYLCLECQGPVRLRGGMHRQSHFYHLYPSSACRQNGKSLVHLQVQLALQNLLPACECQLEYRFPSIGRIADAAWLPQKIVFEIQCSPIYVQEIIARNRDYGSEGFAVVWILHDYRYNQPRVFPAETFLTQSPHYYTDIDENGEGAFYDQLSYMESGERIATIGKHPVNLAQPKIPLPNTQRLPGIMEQRLKNWPFCFEGDFLDGLSKSENTEIQKIILNAWLWEKSRNAYPSLFGIAKKWGHIYVRRPYQLFFQRLLERACQ